MAVLIEAFSVIVRVQAIRDKYFGGVKAFMDDIPNSTFCTDGLLGRVGFMSLDDAFFFSAELMNKGLDSLRGDRENTDIAYAVQDVGLIDECSWLVVERLSIDAQNHEVTACSLVNEIQQGLSVPQNWSYEQYASLSKVGEEEILLMTHENDTDVLTLSVEGKAEKMYLGRTNLKTGKDEPLH
jgi:hypothetical protein